MAQQPTKNDLLKAVVNKTPVAVQPPVVKKPVAVQPPVDKKPVAVAPVVSKTPVKTTVAAPVVNKTPVKSPILNAQKAISEYKEPFIDFENVKQSLSDASAPLLPDNGKYDLDYVTSVIGKA